MTQRYVLCFATAFAVLAAIAFWWRQTPESRRRAVRNAVAQERYSDAIDQSRLALPYDDSPNELHFLSGYSLAKLQRDHDALLEFECIPDDRTSFAVNARWEASEIELQKLSRPARARDQLVRLLTQDPHHTAARVQLSAILGLAGQTWDANQFRFDLVRDGIGTERELVLLGLDDLSVENQARLEKLLKVAPDDPIVRQAEAYSAYRDSDFESAEKRYRAVVKDFPEAIQAQIRLGQLLLSRGAINDFRVWHAALPSEAEAHPDLWELRGDFARSVGDHAGTERCYWEAIQRNPAHRRALQRLGSLLSERGDHDSGLLLLERAANLLNVQVAAKRYHTKATGERAIEAADACAKAGLHWEAWGWSLIAFSPSNSKPRKIDPRPASDAPRIQPLVAQGSLSELANTPLPSWITERSNSTGNHTTIVVSQLPQAIAFEDASEKLRLHFQYHAGDDFGSGEQLAFQFTGGGVAVMDYDGDQWPDLYFTQGNDWPRGTSTRHVDALFRNIGGNSMVDVAHLAGLADASYGQGATVGDIDNDGFPDLYVANLEGGRLYRNQGDGTFADVTPKSSINGQSWTTSCLLADLDGDSYPDLYLVNYLEGEKIFETVCRHPDSTPRGCTPYDFKPAQDRLWKNRGDETFVDLTDDSGIVQPGGNGLGIAAFRTEQAHLPNVFIANDTTANFWFVNRGDRSKRLFDEAAIASGLAFDRDGRAQACMGVAVGDADGDGQMDLFVTNFYDESNTLYLQRSDGFFDDATIGSGLREPSLKQLGFGTQFLDADLDGSPDLVVANGHVDTKPPAPIPSQMPTQIFANQGQGKFVELQSISLGPWFTEHRRGRGLSRVDWNRDGRDEFVVSNLDSPSALLENTSRGTGHFLVVKLVGTASSRDAIGTIVRVKIGNRILVRQLTAGDGYQASNHRQLVFGLGSSPKVDSIDVRWPSGLRQTFEPQSANVEIIVIEGRDQEFLCTK